MLTLLKKEINSFICHPSGVLILVVYLALNGTILWLFPGTFNIIDSEYAQLDGLFLISPILFLVFIPALTMKLFSDEYRDGTIETLLTKPLSSFEVVISKYLSGVILIFVAIIPTLVYYFSIYNLSEIVGNVDNGGIIGSYIGLFLLAITFVSIGTFASSTSKNQIFAFVTTILISAFLLYGLEFIAELFQDGKINLFINYLSLNYHYNSMSKGIIDSRDVLYFISINVLFILLTKQRIEKSSSL